MNTNTLKNIGFVLFSFMIFVAYNFNFADIANQNGLIAAVLVEILLLLPIIFTINKLVTELPSKS